MSASPSSAINSRKAIMELSSTGSVASKILVKTPKSENSSPHFNHRETRRQSRRGYLSKIVPGLRNSLKGIIFSLPWGLSLAKTFCYGQIPAKFFYPGAVVQPVITIQEIFQKPLQQFFVGNRSQIFINKTKTGTVQKFNTIVFG